MIPFSEQMSEVASTLVFFCNDVIWRYPRRRRPASSATLRRNSLVLYCAYQAMWEVSSDDSPWLEARGFNGVTPTLYRPTAVAVQFSLT